MVAVGFNPRIQRPRHGVVAERRLKCWRGHSPLLLLLPKVQSSLLLLMLLHRGLKPTATVVRSLRAKDCPANVRAAPLEFCRVRGVFGTHRDLGQTLHSRCVPKTARTLRHSYCA